MKTVGRGETYRPGVGRPCLSGRRITQQAIAAACELLERRTLLTGTPNNFVVLNASGSGVGSLRLAIVEAEAATGASTITFDPTFFSTPKTINIGSQFELDTTSEIIIQGPTSEPVTIDAGNSGRAFLIDPGSAGAEIDNLTITNAEDDGDDGGAIFDNGNALTLNNVTISDCYAERGGAVAAIGGSLNIASSTITGDSSGTGGLGGGIYSFNSDVTISNTTITLNTADFNGGAIDAVSGSLTITNCTITGNSVTAVSAGYGGGIFGNSAHISITGSTIGSNTSSLDGGGIDVVHGSLTVTNSSLLQNTATGQDGGGIFAKGVPILKVTDSTISGNSALRGGGIYSGDSVLSVDGSTITGNQSSSHGGGIYSHEGADESSVTITNTTISNNNATGKGGGLFSHNQTTTVLSSTISGNMSSTDGGGIGVYGGTLDIANSTLATNAATDAGGGVAAVDTTVTVIDSTLAGNFANTGARGIDANTSPTTLEGTIVATYGGTALAGVTFQGTHNLITDGSGGLTDPSNILNQSNPGLGLLGYYGGATQTMPLLTGSSAIGAGSAFNGFDSKPITTDQRGFARGASIDIGAFQSQSAGPLVVTTTQDDPVPQGTLSLRDAINTVNALGGDQLITFAQGLTGTISLTGGQFEFDNTGTTTITGPGASNLAIDAQSDSRIFVLDANTSVSISGLTLTNGKSPGITNGGAINSQGSLTLSGVVISYSQSGGYGGAVNDQGTLTITNSTITNNQSEAGGGVFSNNDPSVTISDSTFSGNSSGGPGGALQMFQSALHLTDCTLSGNTAQTGGGIVVTRTSGNSSIAIVNSTINQNSSYSFAGAILDVGETLTITNSTVSGNSDARGGVIYVSNTTPTASLTITDSTVVGNSATTGVGGIDGADLITTLSGTIVANNTGGDLNSSLTFQGTYNLIGDGSGGLSGPTNILNENPLLAPLGNYGGITQTMALLAGSPAIDAGHDFGKGFDQRGISRPQGAGDDIGAFESQGFSIVTSGNGQSAAANSSFANPLSVLLAALDDGVPVGGATITFTAPSSGASAVFSGTMVTADDGSASITPTANSVPGAYEVTASIGNMQLATFDLTNLKIDATVTLGDLAQLFTGSPLAATTTTNPAGLTVDVVYTQDGVTVAAPTNPGNYAVTATINDPSYQGSATGTLLIEQPPAITSTGQVTFTIGAAGSFLVSTTGFPAAALSETGALPTGITFIDNGDGTGALAGTPAAGTFGTYPLTFSASNGASPDASQSFLLSVVVPGSLPVTATLSPITTTVSPGSKTNKLSLSITNPAAAKFADNVSVRLYASPSSYFNPNTAVSLSAKTSNLKLNLAGMKSKKTSVQFSSPAAIATGDYFLIAVLNSGLLISSSTATVHFVAPIVDLATTFVSPPTSLGSKNTKVSVRVANNGSVSTASTTTVTLYLAPGDTLDLNADTQLSQLLQKSPIKAGASKIFKLNASAMSKPAGSYFLIVVASNNGTPADSNSANNTASSPITIN